MTPLVVVRPDMVTVLAVVPEPAVMLPKVMVGIAVVMPARSVLMAAATAASFEPAATGRE